MKKILITVSLSLSLILLGYKSYTVQASDEDFLVDTKTEIIYGTGADYVTVKTEYLRSVENRNFYFPATGDKIFHIPDISTSTEEQIAKERQYKIESISVTDDKGTKLNYSVEEKETGEGIYVSVPNYKTTTITSNYVVVFSYNTKDLVTKIGSFVNIIGTSLPRDTEFERRDEESGTITKFNYYLSVVVDGDISPLARAFPTFTSTERGERTYYEFSQTDRVGKSPYLEFGTFVTYRFELEYQTQKTDKFIPEKYSDFFSALSTNIYELSLPREFSETRQKVYFDNIQPKPKSLYKDNEGNILAIFEVPANKESKIVITGYITVEQDEWEETSNNLNIPFSEYLTDIQEVEYIDRYLKSTKYWQSSDELIMEEAEKLKEGRDTILDIVRANYRYINEKLEYDTQKATSENERIGAKEALLGGPAVCMEYADLMIALLRAQGIPSRAAIGYANLTQLQQDEQVRHQWVQIWVPEYGWLSVDPSYESENMKIGQMAERVLWEVFNDDSLSNIRIYSANYVHDLTTEGYVLKVYGVDNEINTETLEVFTDLIPTDEIPDANSSQTWMLANTLMKTTPFGKALIITLPILIVLAFLTGIISLLLFTLKRIKKNKKNTI